MPVQLDHTIVASRDRRASASFGVCRLDPDGHVLEIITRPYGG